MKRSIKTVLLSSVTVLSLGSMTATTASARDNINWSVSVGAPYSAGYAPGVIYTQRPVYVQPQTVYVQPQPVYVQPQPVYVRPQPVYASPVPVVQYQSYYVNPYPQAYYYGGHHRGHGYGHFRGHHGHRD